MSGIMIIDYTRVFKLCKNIKKKKFICPKEKGQDFKEF
jgi:hypothetical protein